MVGTSPDYFRFRNLAVAAGLALGDDPLAAVWRAGDFVAAALAGAVDYLKHNILT